jgi:AmiR/NasT family two-component response regulator
MKKDTLKRVLQEERHVKENAAYRNIILKRLLHEERHVEENAAYRNTC